MPVFVDGKRVSFGPGADIVAKLDPESGSLTARPIVREGERIGLVGHVADPRATGEIWIVNRSVALLDADARVGSGLQAVVEVDLPTDLSRQQLLASPQLDALRDVRQGLHARARERVQGRGLPRQPPTPGRRQALAAAAHADPRGRAAVECPRAAQALRPDPARSSSVPASPLGGLRGSVKLIACSSSRSPSQTSGPRPRWFTTSPTTWS
jgi:hypothetical protein